MSAAFFKCATLAEAKHRAEAIKGCAWSNGASAHFVSSDPREGSFHLRFRADSMAVVLVCSYEPIVLPEPYDGTERP